MVKFIVSDENKSVRTKSPDAFLNNGELKIPEEIKKMEGFTLSRPSYDPNEINLKSLDLRGFKIKIDPAFFNDEKLNESNIIVDENSVYQWKDGGSI